MDLLLLLVGSQVCHALDSSVDDEIQYCHGGVLPLGGSIMQIWASLLSCILSTYSFHSFFLVLSILLCLGVFPLWIFFVCLSLSVIVIIDKS